MARKSENVELIVQPGDGIAPLIAGIAGARQSIRIVIFRFDAGQIEEALINAARRGVFVHAMVANTNDDGGGTLRKLEMRLLEQGITVARTAGDLLRYHDKIMIIDEQTLYLLGFNYTYEDIERSRSLGIVTRHQPWVQEAVNLFMADATRQAYTPGTDTFLVSPINARQGLTAFIREARSQLLIYDKRVTDPAMLALLQTHAKAGLDVRIIGKSAKQMPGLNATRLANLRLHTRAIMRDGGQAFIGSQSLRDVEMDARREVGVILHDPGTVQRLVALFEEDWEQSTGSPCADDQSTVTAPADDTVTPQATAANNPATGNGIIALPPDVIAETVKEAVREAVKEVISENPENPGADASLIEMVKQAVREVVAEQAADSA